MRLITSLLLCMLLCQTSSEDTTHKHLLTPDKEPTTDQSIDTTKVPLGEPMHFIGVT